MRLDMSTRLEQQMKLSPRMIQAMEILQLPVMDLQARIEAEMQANPVLEIKAPAADEDDAPPAAADTSPPEADRGESAMVVREGGADEDFQRLSEFQDEYEPWLYPDQAPPRPRAEEAGRDRKLDAMANAPAASQTLHEFLQEQWAFAEVDDLTRRAGGLLITFVDDDGYLRTPLEEIARTDDARDLPLQALRDALVPLQTLEPPGVASRDLRQCLMRQLQAQADAGDDVELELTLVRDFLRDIEMNRLPQIARRVGRSVEEIRQAIGRLARLNPRPGSLVNAPAAPAVMPDVRVELDEQGNVVVTVPEHFSPRLTISRAYRHMAKNRATDRDARAFLRQNIRSAEWLISAIGQRRATLRRVAEEIFRVQKEFLYVGNEALRPLPMADVAERVGVHVATISRTVAGKYAQTPIGIYPLRMFFSGGTKTAAGQDVAWDAIRAKLREIIDAEDKRAPLNDDQIVAALAGHGIRIARRTVAKYRDVMGIGPKQQRRRFT